MAPQTPPETPPQTPQQTPLQTPQQTPREEGYSTPTGNQNCKGTIPPPEATGRGALNPRALNSPRELFRAKRQRYDTPS